jgi:hypothetical protein
LSPSAVGGGILDLCAATGDSEQSVEMRYEDEKIWSAQK